MNFKWKTPKLTASATYMYIPQGYNYRHSQQTQGYNYRHSQQTYTNNCTTKANATANSWTVKFTPEESNTYTITLQVNGNYGGIDLHNTSEYYIEVYDDQYGNVRY